MGDRYGSLTGRYGTIHCIPMRPPPDKFTAAEVDWHLARMSEEEKAGFARDNYDPIYVEEMWATRWVEDREQRWERADRVLKLAQERRRSLRSSRYMASTPTDIDEEPAMMEVSACVRREKELRAGRSKAVRNPFRSCWKPMPPAPCVKAGFEVEDRETESDY
jgi:hypothetical protein